MPIHPFQPIQGTVELFTINSKAVANNLLGDPAQRQVAVYLPPGYSSSDCDYPVLIDLAGFTGCGLHHLGWKSYDGTAPQRLERLCAEGKMGPVVAVFPDTFTSLGGNQYVNSLAMGQWEDFLIAEMLPEIEKRYRIRPKSRGLFGKSSGGFGSIYHGLKHGDVWQAVACHSGDMSFELCYLSEMPAALNRLAQFGRSAKAFLEHLDQTPKLTSTDMNTLMTLAMGASYDPDPGLYKGVRLPVDLRTCALIPDRWEKWLAHDPALLAKEPECQNSLRKLKGIYVDCGFKDQYHLHYGSRRFSDILDKASIDHHYEEFDDNHSGVDYRMDHSLPFLYEALMS